MEEGSSGILATSAHMEGRYHGSPTSYSWLYMPKPPFTVFHYKTFLKVHVLSEYFQFSLLYLLIETPTVLLPSFIPSM